ncbi:MAG: MaoC/PaaZ C-terminal domain-containing protein [Pseudomonadota bacterium]
MIARARLPDVGMALAERHFEPLTRAGIAAYADASGDRNAIHLDDDAAQRAGLPGVIAHGMLTMALLGRYLTDLVPQENVQHFECRFVAMAFPGDRIACRGLVSDVQSSENDRRHLVLDLQAANQANQTLAAGRAIVEAPAAITQTTDGPDAL